MAPRAERRAAPKPFLASDTKAPNAVWSLELFEAEAAARRSLEAGHAAEASWSILSWERKQSERSSIGEEVLCSITVQRPLGVIMADRIREAHIAACSAILCIPVLCPDYMFWNSRLYCNSEAARLFRGV